MYSLPVFQEHDWPAIVDFVRRHPLAMVTGTNEDGRLEATHVPLLIDDSGTELVLRGHVMRKTDHWHGFKANSEVLVAFTGPNAPVLASWYADTNNGGSWNYVAVHGRGMLEFVPEADLVEILRELKNQFEEDPQARFESLTPDYVPGLIPGIEGFRIRITELKAVFKLSQNKDDADFAQIVARLEERGGEAALVAAEMRQQRSRMATPVK